MAGDGRRPDRIRRRILTALFFHGLYVMRVRGSIRGGVNSFRVGFFFFFFYDEVFMIVLFVCLCISVCLWEFLCVFLSLFWFLLFSLSRDHV